MQDRMIKSVTLQSQFAEMEVEFYGGRGGETLKQCPCCDCFHPTYIGACPKTGKIIEAEARRQAEEESQSRELANRIAKAKTEKEKYLLSKGSHENKINWKNSWRYLVALFGLIAVYCILAIVFHFVFDKLSNGPLIALIASFAWLTIWAWLDNRHKKLINNQAQAVYQRVFNGEEVEGAG